MDYIDTVFGEFVLSQWRYVEIFYNEFNPNKSQKYIEINVEVR
jgi:hypothetical protein